MEVSKLRTESQIKQEISSLKTMINSYSPQNEMFCKLFDKMVELRIELDKIKNNKDYGNTFTFKYEPEYELKLK